MWVSSRSRVFVFAHARTPLTRLGSAGAQHRPRRPVGLVWSVPVSCRHASSPPRPVSGLAIVHSGKTGGRRLAHLSNLRASYRPPVGDFCSRLLAAPRVHSPGRLGVGGARGLCVLYLHTQGSIVPPGKPDGGTSPVAMPRQHHNGGAHPSPRNHRHDRCSRWEELTGIMEDEKRGVERGSGRKVRKAAGPEGCGNRLRGFFHVFTGLPRLRHPWAEQERKRTVETRGSMPEHRGRSHTMQNKRPFCTLTALPAFLRHGS
jgi:hypothetical protein